MSKIQSTLPDCFALCPNVRMIIDATEVSLKCSIVVIITTVLNKKLRLFLLSERFKIWWFTCLRSLNINQHYLELNLGLDLISATSD